MNEIKFCFTFYTFNYTKLEDQLYYTISIDYSMLIIYNMVQLNILLFLKKVISYDYLKTFFLKI